MGTARRSISIVVVLVAVCCASDASAQNALEKARQRFEQGEAYFKAGTFDKAAEEYGAAYELVPRPPLLFNIGLCHENLGDTATAIRYYDRYLEAEPNGSKSTEARARREALDRKLEQARAEGERKTVASFLAQEGQRSLEASRFDQAIDQFTRSYKLVPDPEVLFFLAESYRGSGDTPLAEAEYRRYLESSPTGARRAEASRRLADIEAQKRRALSSDSGASVSTSSAAREPRSVWPAVVSYSVAGVAFSVAVLTGLDAKSRLDEIDQALDLGTPPLDTGDPRFSRGKSAARTANVAFAIGGIAAATGVALTIWWLRGREGAEPAPSRAELFPVIDGEQVGVSLGGRF